MGNVPSSSTAPADEEFTEAEKAVYEKIMAKFGSKSRTKLISSSWKKVWQNHRNRPAFAVHSIKVLVLTWNRNFFRFFSFDSFSFCVVWNSIQSLIQILIQTFDSNLKSGIVLFFKIKTAFQIQNSFGLHFLPVKELKKKFKKSKNLN